MPHLKTTMVNSHQSLYIVESFDTYDTLQLLSLLGSGFGQAAIYWEEVEELVWKTWKSATSKQRGFIQIITQLSLSCDRKINI